MRKNKAYSWLFSLAIHGTGLILVLVAGFHLTTPEGTVSDKVEFEAVGDAKALPPPPIAAPPAPVPQPPTAAAPPVEEKAVEETKVAEEPPAPDEPVDEAPHDEGPPPPAIVQKEDSAPKMTQPDMADEPKADAAGDATGEAAAPSPSDQSQAESSTAEAVPSPTATPVGPSGIGPDKSIPQYGTPGTTLDETKLTEAYGNRKPSYPWMARLKRQEGTVVIRAYIDKLGVVSQVAIERSSGSSLIDQEALRSYSRWKYQPGPTGWVLKPFKFSLK